MSPRKSTRLLDQSSSAAPAQDATPPSDITVLRRQWKWAAVSQFFYIFAPLMAVDGVTLNDIEDDLVFSSVQVMPRVMHRLLYTLTGDRRINVDNWQTGLRRQYLRRDPENNPLGWEIEPPVKRERESVSQSRRMSTDDLNDSDASSSHDVPEQSHVEGDEPTSTGETEVEVPSKEIMEPEEGVEQPKDWTELSMLEKLSVMHTLIEWHFQNPVKLRNIMRSDDEHASWRAAPVGYDASSNAYWLIGPDRLWIQRELPKPPRSNLKRKASTNAGSRKKKAPRNDSLRSVKEETPSVRGGSKKKRSVKATNGKQAPSRSASVKNGRRSAKIEVKIETEGETSSGRSRAAKTKANIKLDIQAKQLAATRAELMSLNKKGAKGDARQPPPPLGTRVSRRLRGNVDDEWQQVPEEWLVDGSNNSTPGAGKSQEGHSDASPGGLGGFDDESDLTELSDTESIKSEPEAKEDSLSDGIKYEEEEEVILPVPAGFIEWETICVTMEEWENVAIRFENATHYREKALHRILSQDIVPDVLGVMREIEKKRQKEEAVVNRKRSSRIAIKESEKEEARLTAQRRAAENEQMARARRAEARAKKETEEKERREKAREQRQQERWEREAKAKTTQSSESDLNINENGELQLTPSNGYKSVSRNGAASAGPEGTAQASTSSQTWELNCEICGVKGINRDDGVPLMSCGKCSRWQHIVCHDSADLRAGRPRRDWRQEDFTCKLCLTKMSNASRNNSGFQRPIPQTVNGRGAPDYPSPSNGPLSAAQVLSDMRSVVSSRGSSSGPYERQDFPQNHHSSYGVGARSDTHSPIPRSRSQAALTFAHYEPHQRGFSSHISLPPPMPSRVGEQGHYDSSVGYAPQAQYGWRPYSAHTNGGQPPPLPSNLLPPNMRASSHAPYGLTADASMTHVPYGSHLSGRDATLPLPSSSHNHYHQPVRDGQMALDGSAHHLGRGPILPAPSPLSRDSGIYPMIAPSTSNHYQR